MAYLGPGAPGYMEPTTDNDDDNDIDSDVDNDDLKERTDIYTIDATFTPQSYTVPYGTQYDSSPALPYIGHNQPTLKALSNKFRQKGPNKIMYPPKNGPIALIKKYGGNPVTDLPNYDPFDELTLKMENETKQVYSNELTTLYAMQFTNELQNIRSLYRHKNLINAQSEINSIINNKYSGIYIGDKVQRGPDWKWGNQDGASGLIGTVRGLRQWHPSDNIMTITECVILWDHGLYGNYRFNYRGAYDIIVIGRLDAKSSKMEPIGVGDSVVRKQKNWRWNNQDGGLTGNNGSLNESWNGTIIELYASPAPFEGGARISVKWDKDQNKWKDNAIQYKLKKEKQKKIDKNILLDLSTVVTDDDDDDDDTDDIDDSDNDDDADDEEEDEIIVMDDNDDMDSDIDLKDNDNDNSNRIGAKLTTSGIVTDDPWKMSDDYAQWDFYSTALWIRNLNDEFEEYADTVELNEFNGTYFDQFVSELFWITRVQIQNKNHIKALICAAKYRIKQYKKLQNNKQKDKSPVSSPLVKKGSILDDFNDPIPPNNNNNNNNVDNVDNDAPPAFSFDIPEMDLPSSHHLSAPQNDIIQLSDEGDQNEGVTDDDGADNDDDNIPAAAAPAFSNNQQIKAIQAIQPGTTIKSDFGIVLPIPNTNIIKKKKKKIISKKKKKKPKSVKKQLKFWQKVIIRERLNPFDPHITHGQYGMSHKEKITINQKKKKDDNNNSDDDKSNNSDSDLDEDEYEWKEPDFDELLSKPIPKYRWGISYNYDLEIREAKQYLDSREYLMIDDRVSRGPDFTIDPLIGDYKSDFGIVLKIEQWDDTRTDNDSIRGDKIYLTWASFRPFRFNYNNKYDISFHKRGQVFANDYSHIRVGDRVVRGFSWTDDMYNAEDGGPNSMGTVVAIQYVLQVTGIIAKVLWHKNNHINLYSWGFKNVYDLRRL